MSFWHLIHSFSQNSTTQRHQKMITKAVVWYGFNKAGISQWHQPFPHFVPTNFELKHCKRFILLNKNTSLLYRGIHLQRLFYGFLEFKFPEVLKIKNLERMFSSLMFLRVRLLFFALFCFRRLIARSEQVSYRKDYEGDKEHPPQSTVTTKQAVHKKCH